MNHMICKGMKSLMFSMLFLACAESQAQGTLQDYNRAYALRHQFSADSVFHWHVPPLGVTPLMYFIIK